MGESEVREVLSQWRAMKLGPGDAEKLDWQADMNLIIQARIADNLDRIATVLERVSSDKSHKYNFIRVYRSKGGGAGD